MDCIVCNSNMTKLTEDFSLHCLKCKEKDLTVRYHHVSKIFFIYYENYAFAIKENISNFYCKKEFTLQTKSIPIHFGAESLINFIKDLVLFI